MNYTDLTLRWRKMARIAALASFLPAWIYVRFYFAGGDFQGVGALAFAIAYIIFVEGFAYADGLTTEELRLRGGSLLERIFLTACLLIQTLAIALFGLKPGWEIPQTLMFHFTGIYYCLTRTGMLTCGTTDILLPLDTIVGTVILPFSNLNLRAKALYFNGIRRQEREAGNLPPRRLARLGITVPVMTGLMTFLGVAFAWYTLGQVSDAFSALGRTLFRPVHALFSLGLVARLIHEELPLVILSIPVGAYIYGLVGGCLCREHPLVSRDDFDNRTMPYHIFPAWSGQVIITALCLVYALFLVTAGAEMALLAGSGEEISAGRACLMAADGFWQLGGISVLNFAVFGFLLFFSQEDPMDSRRTRFFLTALFLFGTVFALLACYKLFFVYVGHFGLTPRRFLSAWMVVILLLWNVMAVLRLHFSFSAARIGILTAAVSYSVLTLAPLHLICG